MPYLLYQIGSGWADLATVRALAGQPARLSGAAVLTLDYRLAPERVRRALESQQPSARALMESLTVSFQRDQGKRRWAEKTPKHLWHVAASYLHVHGLAVVQWRRVT